MLRATQGARTLCAQHATPRNGIAAMVGDAAVFSAVTVVVAPLNLFIGPALAWYLHGRRLDKLAVTSVVVGVVAGVVSVGAAFLLVLRIGRLVGPMGGSEFTGGVVLLVVAATALVTVIGVLDVDAARDLAAKRRNHIRIDVARLVSTAIIAAGTVGVTIVQLTSPASEIGDVGPFALMSAAIAALAMFFGSALCLRWREKREAVEPPVLTRPSA